MKTICANCGRPIERIRGTTQPDGGGYWSHVIDGGHATDCRLSATPARRTAVSLVAILEHLDWWRTTVDEMKRSPRSNEHMAGVHMGELLDAIVGASK